MMADQTFAQILEDLRREGDGYMGTLPDNWMQGRTTYGGLTASIMLEAANRAITDLPPLRSAMINFIGPMSFAPDISVAVLRQGRNVTSVEAKCFCYEQAVATAAFSFGNQIQQAQISQSLPAPDAPPPAGCEAYIPEFAAKFAPAFTRNFETRLIAGNRPITAADNGYIRCWSRHRDKASQTGMASLLCIADILPPGIFPMLRQFGPNSSMNWLCNFLVETPQTEDGWWHLETSMSAANHGYSSQSMRVWNSEGRMVIDGMQACLTFA